MRGKPGGNQTFDRAIEQFFPRVAKQQFNLSIDEGDAPCGPDQYRRGRGGFDHHSERRSFHPSRHDVPCTSTPSHPFALSVA